MYASAIYGRHERDDEFIRVQLDVQNQCVRIDLSILERRGTCLESRWMRGYNLSSFLAVN